MNKKEGFIGWGLKKDEAAEPLGECSDLDEVMAISREGTLKINKVAEKEFFGADILHATIFQRGDSATTYNVVYVHKENGATYAKRFHMGEGVVRDRAYPIAGGKILYLVVTPTPEEAPKVTVTLERWPGRAEARDRVRLRDLAVKNRGSQGNIMTKLKVQKVVRSR